MLEGLQAILDKAVVLSTVNADDLLNRTAEVEANYTRHVVTFIPMGDTGDFSRRLTRLVINAKTPKGLIVADYGYGKTSTLAFLWHECERQDLLAVPPFYCASLLDMLKATYGWAKFRVEARQPDLVDDLDAVYEKHTAATVEEMAQRYAHDHGIANVTAVGMLNAMLDDGSLVLELTPANLLFFLDSVSSIVMRAGFQGLVLFPDEFQQYFSRGANLRRVVQEFREFVWGLDTRSTPLGVVLSIPEYAESVIQEQGRDIIHRLKKDNLYYRLEDIYSVEFPEQLWQRYSQAFSLGDAGNQVMNRDTLRAIGQITERRDLGEGPRTVIDSFKRAIRHYVDRQSVYTPIDLIDDFLESNIRFQAQANKLKSVVRQVLGSSIVNSDAKAQAVKLMAAYPRGCPVDVQKQYNLYNAIVELSKQSHGEILVRTAEGDTLLGLTRSEVAVRTVDLIITRFWQTFEEDELHKEAAIRAFTEHILPRFFQQRRGAAAVGWGSLEFAPTTQGSWLALTEGSFSAKYPHRLLSLQVAYDEDQLEVPDKFTDMQLDFLFVADGANTPGKLILDSDRLVRFVLNVEQKTSGGLPDDIRKLQEYVLPEFVTPLLMLSLMDYFGRWEEYEDRVIPEADKAEIEHLVGRLAGYTIQVLFSRELGESITPPLRRVGLHMIEELVNKRCEHLYPEYRTLFVQAQYESVLNDYINAMRDMTLKERRGHATVESTKESLARRFGLGSVATFENRIENEYAELLRKGRWQGRGDQSIGEVQLQLHPLEQVILRELRGSNNCKTVADKAVPVLGANEVANAARGLGYRDEETLLALQLLAARGYARFDQQDKVIYLAQVGPEPEDLRRHIKRLREQLAAIPTELLSTDTVNRLRTDAEGTSALLESVLEDEEELDEVQTRVNDLDQQLSRSLSDRRGALQHELNELVLTIERELISLQQASTLDRQIQGQVAFVMHLNELRQLLEKKRRGLIKEHEALKAQLEATLLGAATNDPIEGVLNLYSILTDVQQRASELRKNSEELRELVGNLEKWIKLLRDCDRLFNDLGHLPELRSQLTQEVVPEIQATFTKQKELGLGKWEIYAAKLRELEEELQSHQRHGNQIFGDTKEGYETILRGLDVADFRLRTRYTYGEDQESYQDLYEEIKAKIEGRLHELDVDLEREQNDLLKAKYIHNVDPSSQTAVSRIEKELRASRGKLERLQRTLNLTMIRNGEEEFGAFAEQVADIRQTISVANSSLGPLIFQDHPLTEAELGISDILNSKSDLDLTDLFVKARQSGNDIALDGLLTILEGLYRKNRVMIRIRRRA